MNERDQYDAYHTYDTTCTCIKIEQGGPTMNTPTPVQPKTSLPDIEPLNSHWEPSDPEAIEVPGLNTSAPLQDQLEQLEQLITIRLQVSITPMYNSYFFFVLIYVYTNMIYALDCNMTSSG